MLRFLSDAWCAAARRLVEDVRLPSAPSLRAQFDVAGEAVGVVVDAGRVTTWRPGPVESADVVLRWPRAAARQILQRELRADDALLATTVVARDADGPYVGAPAPLGLARRPELAALPLVPGATFAVEYRYRGGPFGPVRYGLFFEEGRVTAERLGPVDRPHVTVEVSYLAMARVRCGEIDILEALESGRVAGDLGPLAALAGISESGPFHAAELATGRHALALAVLGQLDGSPAFAAAMQELAARTEPE